MPTVLCKNCGCKFHAKPSWIARGVGKFCSAKCQHSSQRNGKIVKCFICSREVYKTQRALKHSVSKKYFCSKSCQTKWRNGLYVGNKHPNFVDGGFTHRRIMLESKKPQICTLCKCRDIRVLAVHHIDENHLNNDLKNLAWLCHNCHFLVHHDKLEKSKFMEALV